jgi:hypothetical protein
MHRAKICGVVAVDVEAWIWFGNLRLLVQGLGRTVGNITEDSDWDAIETGFVGTSSEAGLWFDYPIGPLRLFVAHNFGANETT